MTVGAAEPVERDEETLALFIEESLEGLLRIERLLLEAERGAASDELVPTVFRELHTIKGTSGFLGLRPIQSVAHATEDLLARARDQKLSLGPGAIGRLIEASDRLKRDIERLARGGTEPPDDVADLVARLRATELHEPAPAAPPEPAAPVEAADAKAAGTEETVRVSVTLLDDLMNLMGELVLARNQVRRLLGGGSEGEQTACQRLDAVTSSLQQQITKTRLQPVGRVFDKVPRMVRDLAHATGKEVAARVEGSRTEIDRALVDVLRDPVLHLVRNAVDHGIEPPDQRVARGKPAAGRVAVRASHAAGLVRVEITDDGRGIDPAVLRRSAVTRGWMSAEQADALTEREALELIFRPGFSTAAQVTAISGRGVGMDVVRTQVEAAGGQVEVDSTPGAGTTIRLQMPLTLAIIPVLLVSAGGQRFAIPQSALQEILFLDGERLRAAIEEVRGVPVTRLRGQILPLVNLAALLRLPAVDTGGVHVLVLGAGEHRYGLCVDAIDDTEEIVAKPLAPALKRLMCYAGAAVMGDGGVALILDAAGIAERAGLDLTGAREEAAAADGPASAGEAAVVFRAGQGTHCLVPLAMVARLERVSRAAIERVAGGEVVQHDGSVLPIIRPERVIPLGALPDGAEQALIIFEFGRRVALAVDEIVDVVDLTGVPRVMGGDTPYAVGKAVVFDRAALMLDVYRLVRDLSPHVVTDGRKADRALRVLVAEDSTALRAALVDYLRAMSVEVMEAASAAAALQILRAPHTGRVDAVIADVAMDASGGLELVAAAKRERPALPVFGWLDDPSSELAERARAMGADECVSSLRREDLWTALERRNVGRTG